MRLPLCLLLPAAALFLVACGDEQPVDVAKPLLHAAQLEALARDVAVVATGKRIFETGKGFCTTCHGVGGAGTPQGAELRSGRWKHGGSLAEIQQVISNGVPGTAMAAWGQTFSSDDLAALAIYVRSLAPAAGAAASTPAPAAAAP